MSREPLAVHRVLTSVFQSRITRLLKSLESSQTSFIGTELARRTNKIFRDLAVSPEKVLIEELPCLCSMLRHL